MEAEGVGGGGGGSEQPVITTANGAPTTCQNTDTDRICDGNDSTRLGDGNPVEGKISSAKTDISTVDCVSISSQDGAEKPSGGTDQQQVNGKRRRHRRKQKGGRHHPRKWKPYNKLTWEERKLLEERECRRACKKRENRFASGQAMAPYNTTQFLMEQHEPTESELHLDESRPLRDRSFSDAGHLVHSGSGSGEGSSDEFYDSNEEEIFLEKDFTEAYEQYRAERLQTMTKEDLVKEYLCLEGEVESLKKQMKDLQSTNRRYSSESGSGSLPQTPLIGLQSPRFEDKNTKQSKAASLQMEIQRLREENDRLVKENGQLKGEGDKMDTAAAT